MIFGLDRMNFQILLLQTPTLSELRMSGSRLFQSFIIKGKKGAFEEVMFCMNLGILSEFLVKYLEFVEGTNWKR